MNELTTILLSTGLGFLGTIIGGSVTWWVTKRSNATATTLRLYDEWSSESMLAMRHSIQEVRSLFDRDQTSSLDRTFHSLSPEHRAYIWAIIHFYDKLYVMIDNGQCNNELIPDLFGETFYWWYLNCFEAKLLPSKSRISSIRIQALKEWLDKNSAEDDVSRWRTRESETTKRNRKGKEN